MDKRWLIGWSTLVTLALVLSGCRSRPTAEEIVAHLQEVEASTEDVHGIMEVSVDAAEFDARAVVEVWEQQPNKFRAEVLEASESDLVGVVTVTDGQQAWAYHPGENEVVVGQTEGLGPTSAQEMLEFSHTLVQHVLETFDVELQGEEQVAGVETYELVFTPKEDEGSFLPSNVQATLWVDQERWVVLQAHFVGDVLGEGWLRVRSFELNTGIDDDVFQFEIPEGAEVIEVEEKMPAPVTLEDAQEATEFDLLVPTYLPDGVTLIDVFTVDQAYVFHYNHATDISFTLWQRPESAGGGDPENPFEEEAEEVIVRDHPGLLLSDSPERCLLSWTEDGVAFQIAGDISPEEALKVAESLE